MAYTPVEYKIFNPREEVLPYLLLYNKAYEEQEKKLEEYAKFLSSSSELLKNSATYGATQLEYENSLNAMTDALSRGDLMAARLIDVRAQYNKLQEGQAKADTLSKLIEALRTAPKGTIFSHRYTEDDFDSITPMSTYTTLSESTYEKMGEALGNSLITTPEVAESLFDGAAYYMRQGYSALDALKLMANSNSKLKLSIEQIKASSGIEDEIGLQLIENALMLGILTNAGYKYSTISDPRIKRTNGSGAYAYDLGDAFDDGGAIAGQMRPGGNPNVPIVPPKEGDLKGATAADKALAYREAQLNLMKENINYYKSPEDLMHNIAIAYNKKAERVIINPFSSQYGGCLIFKLSKSKESAEYYVIRPKREGDKLEYTVEQLVTPPENIIAKRTKMVTAYNKSGAHTSYRNLGLAELNGNASISDTLKALLASLGTVRIEASGFDKEFSVPNITAKLKIYDPDHRISALGGTGDEWEFNFKPNDLLESTVKADSKSNDALHPTMGSYAIWVWRLLPEMLGSTTTGKTTLEFMEMFVKDPRFKKTIRALYAYIHGMTGEGIPLISVKEPVGFPKESPSAYREMYEANQGSPAAQTRQTPQSPPAATADSTTVTDAAAAMRGNKSSEKSGVIVGSPTAKRK